MALAARVHILRFCGCRRRRPEAIALLSDIVKEIRSVGFIPRGGLSQDELPGWALETHPSWR